MIEGGVIALVFLVIGYVSGRARRRMTPILEKQKVAKCACKHVRSMHVDGKGACTEIEVTSYWEWDEAKNADVLRHKEYPCACKIYDGPEPLPSYFAPEIQS